MSTLHLIKASAGSGKTHKLIGFFLQLLINEDPTYFKGILAVTFTNKATEELKIRLIKELDILRSGKPSDYLQDLIAISNKNEKALRDKANAILFTILHQYSWLSIETIDTFFQRIIRTFTRELAIGENFKLELKNNFILAHAIDNMLDTLEPNSELLNWLSQFSEVKMEAGKTWNIRSELLNLGQEIFKEVFSVHSATIYKKVKDRKELFKYRDTLNTLINTIKEDLASLAKNGLLILDRHGYTSDDLYQGKNGVIGFFNKLASGTSIDHNSYIPKLLDSSSKWPSGSTLNKLAIIEMAETELLPLLQAIVNIINEKGQAFHTAQAILKNIYALGILADIDNHISLLRSQNNLFLISDSTAFIARIIDNNDAPFIYEKMGNRYQHFLLDEFQDTSYLQWNNFKPLLSNSLSSALKCLLVGDVKQAIYRWRNSAWEILESKVVEDFGAERVIQNVLETNYRSNEKIIKFNNALFPIAAGILQELNFKEMETISPEFDLNLLFAGVKQKIPNNAMNKGYVAVRFYNSEYVKENTEYYEDELIVRINQLLTSGYLPGDITILVRSKKEGEKIANFLIDQNDKNSFCGKIGVMSHESLYLSSSNSVKLLVAAMQYFINNDEKINRTHLLLYYTMLCNVEYGSGNQFQNNLESGFATNENFIRSMPPMFIANSDKISRMALYEMTEELIDIFNLSKNIGEHSYLSTFLNMVHEFTGNNPASLNLFLDFWKEEGIKKSVQSAESSHSIRILTIHKSKGLQFKAVIIPFCDWDFKPKGAGNFLWGKPTSPIFNYLPAYPISSTKELLKTEFKSFYEEEQFKIYTDNINLLYVALTRAVEAMVIFAEYNNSVKNNSKQKDTQSLNIAHVGNLLFKTFSSKSDEFLVSNFKVDEELFEVGQISKTKAMDSNSIEDFLPIPYVFSTSVSNRLFFDPSGHELFKEELEQSGNQRLKGKILHHVLSQICTNNDVGTAIKKAEYDGLLSTDEAIIFKQNLLLLLSNAEVIQWFNGSGEVLNEINIIAGDEIIRRPDRVIIYTDRVVVVDYKSGAIPLGNSHKIQVMEYMELIRKMGYNKVLGFLWYTQFNQVIEV